MQESDHNNASSNTPILALINSLSTDIRSLTSEQRDNFKELSNGLSEVKIELGKLEVRQEQVTALEAAFKRHVDSMAPVRDEVIGIKKLSRVAVYCGSAIPIVLGAVLAIWHPWVEYTQGQLDPVYVKIRSIEDKQAVNLNKVHEDFMNQDNRISALEAVNPIYVKKQR